jgi:hypothetical protein
VTVSFPPKVSDEHRWVALASFTLTEGQARTLASGGHVKLADHNRVLTQLGCLDCEEAWPIEGRCKAAASPEMAPVTSSGSPMEESDPRLVAAVDAIARSGATGFEVGHLEDGSVPVPLARWYATAKYKGAKITADEHASPIAAVEELLAKIMVGGGCVKCRRSITLPNEPGAGAPERCTWSRLGDMWVPGCVADADVDEYIAERKQHR